MQNRPLDFIAANSQNAADEAEKTPGERLQQLARLGLAPGSLLAASRPAIGECVDVAVLKQMAPEFLSSAIRLRQSPSTIDGKRIALDKFFWWLDAGGHQSVGREQVQAFVDYVEGAHRLAEGRWGRGENDPEAARFVKPASARTIRFYYKHIRHFLGWAEQKGVLARNPALGVEVIRQCRTLIQPFTLDQVTSLLRAARAGTMPRRDEAIFLFMFDTGVRAAELCHMKLCDLEFKQDARGRMIGGGRVKILGKGDKERIVPFARRVATALWNYLQVAPGQGSDRIFVAERGWRKGEALTPNGLLQLYERMGKCAGVTGVRCTPHTMRHTFAINFLRRGGDIRTLAYLMGHESLSMTMRYLNIAEADAENQHRLYSPADALEW
jgi:site-specific recombinase XerD